MSRHTERGETQQRTRTSMIRREGKRMRRRETERRWECKRGEWREPSRSTESKPYSSLDVGISDRLLTLTAWCYGGGFTPGQSRTNMQEILEFEDALAEETKGKEIQNIQTMCCWARYWQWINSTFSLVSRDAWCCITGLNALKHYRMMKWLHLLCSEDSEASDSRFASWTELQNERSLKHYA